MNPVDITIPARDGFELAATRFGDGDRVVLISSATAVPRRFYRHFANALANAGFVAITYDYRGIGGSRPENLKGFDAIARDWVLKDMAGVIDWIHASLEPASLQMIGHSIGGQLAGLLDNASAIDAMVTFSAQSGYWRLQGGEQKAIVAFHSYITFRVLTSLYGYVPWSKMGAEDLPKGVADEWSKWCRHPEYLLGDSSLPLERYNHFRAPVLAYSFDDDKWGTSRAVDAMMKAYPNLERKHVIPAAAGLKEIAHFGYFKPSAEPLWSEVFDWLRADEKRIAA